MSLPPTGDEHYSVYLSGKSVTSRTKEELAFHTISTEVFNRMCHLGKSPWSLSTQCAELAKTHKSIVDPPNRVSSPSDPSSILLGLHYTPLKAFPDAAGGGSPEENLRTALRDVSEPQLQEEQVIFSGICHDHFAIVEPIYSESLMGKDTPTGAEYFVFSYRLFDLLVRDIKQAREPTASNSFRQQSGPTYFDRDIHLGVDVVVYRLIIALAEFNGLIGFRIFPALSRLSQDHYRYDWELKIREARAGLVPPLVDGGKHVWRSESRDVPLYLPLVYCAGCGKKLVGAERKKCAGCGVAYSCSGECQKKDWELFHKDECRTFKRFFAAQKFPANY